MQPLLELKDIVKSFGSHRAVDSVSLSLNPQDKTVIIGPSGSGKSTLLRTINFLETIDSGSIMFEGRDVGYRRHKGHLILDKPRNICKLRAQIGMVFQHFNLFPHMTVVENAMEGQVTVQGLARKEAREIAMSMLDKVGMKDFADRYPAALSGGQKQRAAIARALAMRPKLMLFDEPTSALDPELVGEVFATIKQLADEGMTMIIVTHNMGFAREVADQLYFMEDGSFLAQGEPDEFFGKHCNDPRIQSFIQRIF
ncbi:ectoine/hydroxyectoine ABC transporter ATP-binding protein EhuA [Oceanidesulfovibrio indonesiensis]|jgi:polar amino acid transport system ATP-binding protein|uniref:Ectoine/hydroxyectoine ABC transporter ATP-binding protein EhuA n=1 Tax=Oceanidesulfovibrio indonesiensis TaxID=54767 RepID=A0A7M3MGH5_9BACT|nr:amino acid ABC transporter ATP-binding protein [Oceanidesulfovibrio indonesiensis]TVM18359.1 ectoine/hydroxyectoine ABC transporter ATP-binding protein EhuA [Oceanidesulfovibrio indonesiensis]